MKEKRGITLIALVVTIVVLLILVGASISMLTGYNGIITKSKTTKEENNKQSATEIINLKITNTQMKVYAKENRMPILQEIADDFCEDNEIQYVTLESKKTGSIEKITVGEAKSIYTKLKDYPYEFEIN